MTTSRDLVLLLAVVVLVVVGAASAVLARRRLAGLLTAREWRILGKLVAIVVLLFVLMLARIARDFPSAMFIYGRF